MEISHLEARAFEREVVLLTLAVGALGQRRVPTEAAEDGPVFADDLELVELVEGDHVLDLIVGADEEAVETVAGLVPPAGVDGAGECDAAGFPERLYPEVLEDSVVELTRATPDELL